MVSRYVPICPDRDPDREKFANAIIKSHGDITLPRKNSTLPFTTPLILIE
jgi:hypothetical protein